MVNFVKTIRDQDMFGHVISLNFNKKGESHTTTIGGFVSIWIKIAFSIYCYMQIEKLITLGDNNLVTTILQVDLEEFGEVDLEKSNYHSFLVIKKQSKVGGTCKLDKEFYKNLDIKFQERHINWNYDAGNTTTTRWFEARECKQSDFGDHEMGKKTFSNWLGFTLVCPEIPEG